MPQTLLEQLHVQRAKLITEAQTLHGDIQRRGDGANAEERARIDKMLNRSEELRQQIDSETTLRDLAESKEFNAEVSERSLRQLARSNQQLADAEGAGPADGNALLRRMAHGEGVRLDGSHASERGFAVRIAPLARMRTMRNEGATAEQVAAYRSQYIEREWDSTTANSGGYTIQTDVASMIYDFMERIGGIRAAAPRIINTMQGNPLNLPRVTVHNAAAAATAEGAAAPAREDTLDRLALTPAKYTGTYDLTEELLEDTEVDLMGFVTPSLGRNLGRSAETAYTTAFIAGIAAGNTITGAGTTVATNLDIARNDPGDVKFKLDAEYLADRTGIKYLMDPTAHRAILKLRDDRGQPLYKSSDVTGEPDMIEGCPVVYNPLMNKYVAASKNLFLFAAAYMMEYFIIRDVGSMEVTASRETEFRAGDTVYRAKLRTVGAVLHARAGAGWKAANN